VAKSRLGPGEAGLLRAVADLVEKEQVARAQSSAAPLPKSTIVSKPLPEPVQAAPPKPTPVAVQASPAKPAEGSVPTERRKRLVIRLSHTPVADIAESLEEFIDSELKLGQVCESIPKLKGAVLVPEPLSNSLLVSGPPEIVDSLTELIADLDAEPDLVMVDVCIAELLPASSDGGADDAVSDNSAMAKSPLIEEDAAAWLQWAEDQGRLQVLSRPQVLTLDNQPAFIQIGRTVPVGTSALGTTGSVKDNQVDHTQVGLTVGLTPRISPEDLVVLDLDVEHTTVLNGDGAAGPIIGKTIAQTTISAKQGRTIVLGGLVHRPEDGRRSLIIAVTPRVNPTR
jgi:type II secretory pathway component GspD/PulD (secretin)